MHCLYVFKAGWCNCAEKKPALVMDKNRVQWRGQDMGRDGMYPKFTVPHNTGYSSLVSQNPTDIK